MIYQLAASYLCCRPTARSFMVMTPTSPFSPKPCLSHVVLQDPVKWKFAPNSISRVFYDSLHSEVVVFCDSRCFSSNFVTSSLFEYPFSVPLDTKIILDAKFSPSRDYLIVQNSITEVVCLFLVCLFIGREFLIGMEKLFVINRVKLVKHLLLRIELLALTGFVLPFKKVIVM